MTGLEEVSCGHVMFVSFLYSQYFLNVMQNFGSFIDYWACLPIHMTASVVFFYWNWIYCKVLRAFFRRGKHISMLNIVFCCCFVFSIVLCLNLYQMCFRSERVTYIYPTKWYQTLNKQYIELGRITVQCTQCF